MHFPTAKILRSATAFVSLPVLVLIVTIPALSQTETVLHSFAGSPDGANPYFVAAVIDSKGNLYGTTARGGAHDSGTVFELTPSGVEKILHSFGAAGDGNTPYSSLIMDTKGNLYGTTAKGGAYGGGTVFELTPSRTKKILHSFGAGRDGSFPYAGLVLDAKRNFYGTTVSGGAHGVGTVFKLTSSGKETILHSFSSNGTDGYNPYDRPVLDAEGNLYGTTFLGGAHHVGTVFKLTPSGKETILHSFNNLSATGDGFQPWSELVLDANRNLYGTTTNGGANFGGTVFELTPSGVETILYSFGAMGDGSNPMAGLAFDTKGNLYGTTYEGSGASAYGTVFQLALSGTETILHSFNLRSGDGAYPVGGVALDAKGSLYGATLIGGVGNSCSGSACGTMFKVTP